jgi:hypothetical protein
MSPVDCRSGDGAHLWTPAGATQHDLHSPQHHNASLEGKGPHMARPLVLPTLEELRASVERSQRLFPPLVSERLLPLGFVRDGRFTLRPIWHPDSDVLRRIDIHRCERHRTHCPDLVRSTDPDRDYPQCELCQLAGQRDEWQLRRRAQILVYAYLYQAQPACAYWKPGRPFLAIGDLRFGYTYCTMLEALLRTAPEVALDMVNPFVPGPGMTLEVHKGPQGCLSMSPLTAAYLPPVPLGEWYQPLEQCVIRPGFDLQTYQACLLAARGSYLGEEQTHRTS